MFFYNLNYIFFFKIVEFYVMLFFENIFNYYSYINDSAKKNYSKYFLDTSMQYIRNNWDIVFFFKKIKFFAKHNVSIFFLLLQIVLLVFFVLKMPKIFFFKLLFKHFYFLSLVYFIFLTFSFLHFTNFFSRNNSFLSRFWRRSIIIFWALELLTFCIFLYLTLISPELNKLYYFKKPHLYIYNKYSYFNQFYLMFVLVCVNLLLCVNLRNKVFFSLNFYKLLTLFVVLFMLHFFFYEFMKFFFTLSYYKKKKFEYINHSRFSKQILQNNIDDSLFLNVISSALDVELRYKNFFSNNSFLKKKKIIKNFKYQTRKHLMLLISILKFWHVFFVFFVLLISLKSFYLENCCNSTSLLSVNILNINFLLLFNLLGYFLLFKQVIYRQTLLRYNILYYVT